MAASSSSGSDGRRSGFFRNAFKAMNNWGDEFERRHFDGDLKGAMARGSQKAAVASTNTWKAMNDWGEEFEQRHFEGDLVGTLSKAPQIAGTAINSTLETLDSSLEAAVPVLESTMPFGAFLGDFSSADLPPEATWSGAAAPGAPAGPPQEVTASWEQVQHLQDEHRLQLDAQNGASPALFEVAERLRAQIAEERERRRGRATALDALDEALRQQRVELAEERQLAVATEESRSVADAQSYNSERALAQLQERHHALCSRKASHEAEVQRHMLDAAAAAAAARRDEQVREAEGPRAWARAGLEMEALKNAKVELAEVLGLVDEARLDRRRELWMLQKRITDLTAENKQLKLASDGYSAPQGSFRASLRRLLSVAVSGRDPYAQSEVGAA